ncbi:MAG: RdgB/HAM1 family non-canonical purine NTP pyrophosphatase [Verrucomicrobiota bacterium]|nr:RdgB/HAM1 family non-canonical purine NTP pyrophosphatase [Verrucomicrobiota bacterium]
MIQLLVATHNPHKTAEFASILGPEFTVSDLTSCAPSARIEETGTTFRDNAAIKAIAASHLVSQLVVGDDSGIEVDALGGAPGVYSARYAGDHASDEQNVAKLLAALRDVAPEKRTARFQCVLVVAQAGVELASFKGSIEGRITGRRNGTNGFGYDPVFTPEECKQTFAELGPELKNRISHRASATQALRVWLLQAADATADDSA